ncbi:MAG: CRISPR-associated Cse4 family protein [Elusimicrobia bacterium]|nr:MAG: CRISPR-associated Cse4 family protein [Elusimicrobiota bacterium]KAF0157101.1 MAG: CRISPR-associated Cse4 family protein [Elusimicrobiota bacterium]
MKTLIEIHALQNFAPSNLNRDDSGAPKDAWFGGTRRARISSQCLKRAVREHFAHKKSDGFFSSDELAVRTKRVYQAIADSLKGKRDGAEAAAKAEIALSYIKLTASEAGKSQYLLFLGQREITGLAGVIDKHWGQILPSKEEAEETGKKKGNKKKDAAAGAPKEVKEQLEGMLNDKKAGGKAVDIALFGRMLADMPEKNQDAACQVAHAISTHAVEREFDFYTAVDDLKPEDTAAADMMGTVEFNSACFYRYAVVDWAKLLENLQNDKELSAKGLRAFLEGCIVSEPSGKQNSFAAHNPPEFVAVSVRRNTAPRSLANAFERAVYTRRNESITKNSAEELAKKAKALRSVYGGEEKTFVLNLTDAGIEGFGTAVADLPELLDKACAAARE